MNEKTGFGKMKDLLQALTYLVVIITIIWAVSSDIKDDREEEQARNNIVVNEHLRLKDELMSMKSLKHFERAVAVLSNEYGVVNFSIGPERYNSGSVTYRGPLLGSTIMCECRIQKDENDEETNIEKEVAKFCDEKGAKMRKTLKEILADRPL